MRSGILLFVAALISAGALALSGVAIYDRTSSADQARKDDLTAWHSVVCYFEGLTLRNKKTTPAQKAEAIRAWDHILLLVGAPPC